MNYDNLKAINASLIKECVKSPFHGFQYLFGERESSSSMDLGTLVHSLVLEPNKGLDEYYVIPKGAKTASHEEAANGRKIVRAQVLEEAQKIANSVLNCPAAKPFLKDAITEVELTFDVNGTPCKARLDGYTKDGTLIELKTANELYARDFVSSIIRYGYEIQMAFYREALRRNNIEVKRVIIIQATTESPYLCNVYELDELFLTLGDKKINNVFHIAAKLLDGWVPTQSSEVRKLELPQWAAEGL